MQDPSHGVPHQLLQHVHLLSSYQYPFTANTLPQDQMLDFLINAPRVIREVSPVAWTYLSPPRDGTVFLAWQPNCRTDPQFASDGYIWSGPEKTLRSERRGFTFEVFMAESGYDPRGEQLATHRRMRYRLIGSLTGQQVDPALEIVHYCQAPADHRIPARQIPITGAIRKSMTERQWLESQGSLIRKEFMLNDRPNWPSINMPNGQMQQLNYPQQNPMWNRAGQMHSGINARGPGQPMTFQNQAPGRPLYGISAPANRRPNQGPISRMAAGPPYSGMRGAGYFETLSDDEENPSSGDLLDMMTPREISLTRYRQHHEWMEQIFSSPYSTNQITPMALAFGLPGELSELTEGLLHDPTAPNAQWNPDNPIVPRDYQPIGQESMSELEKRVAAFLQRGEEQLNEMRKEHAKRMEEMSQGKQFAELEKKLARAPWDDGSDHGTRTDETVQDIVQKVESSTGSKIVSRDEVKLVQNGGLIREDEQSNGTGLGPSNLQENPDWNMQPKDGEFDAMTFGSFDGTLEVPIAETAEESKHAKASLDNMNVTADAEMASAHEESAGGPEESTDPQDSRDKLAKDNISNEDIDMGEVGNTVDMAEASKEASTGSGDADILEPSDWILVNQEDDEFADEAKDEAGENGAASAAEAGTTTEDAEPTTTSAGTTAAAPTTTNTAQATSGALDAPTADSTPGAIGAAETGNQGATPGTLNGATPQMFDVGGDFGEFDDLDTAGEALEGYGGPEDEDLGLDLEPSAFGDAFENHETPTSGT